MTNVVEELTLNEDQAEEPEIRFGRSYLMADIGSSTTTVALFDIVEGQYRLLSRSATMTTAGPPWFDVSNGLQQAIHQISDATGRVLLNDQGSLIRPRRSNGNGVDEFGVVVSAGAPLRVLVAGLLEEVSISSARHVLESVCAEEVDCFHVADQRERPAQVMALLKSEPDVILLVGGTDGGADKQLVELLETLAIGINLMDEADRPTIIFAGNVELRENVNKTLGKLTDIYFTDNVRPHIDQQSLDPTIALLSELYLVNSVGQLPGMDGLQEWSVFNLKSTAHAFTGMGEYYSALHRARVICLDAGCNQITLASVEPEMVDLTIRTDLGMGQPVMNLLELDDYSEINAWSGIELSNSEIQDFIINKAIQPHTVALNEAELSLEYGILCQAVRKTFQDAATNWNWPERRLLSGFRLILLRGSMLASAARPRMALLAMLDALQPSGVFEVKADPSNILPSMGLLAPDEPEKVIQVLNGGVLENWGWVIAPLGRVNQGNKILEVGIESDGMENLRIIVRFGRLEVFPLPADRPSTVTLKPVSGIDIGYGRGKAGKIKIRGASIGLVIDARGRPLPKSTKEKSRRDLVQQWLHDIGA